MGEDIAAGIVAGLQLLLSADVGDLALLFWFTLVFEVPRHLLGMLVFLIVTLRRGPGRDSAAGRSAPRPFSIIIAGHNEAAVLAKCVHSVWEQSAMWHAGTGRRCGEIIVIDDGSMDDTGAVIAQLRREGLIDSALSLSLRGGKSAAINLGLSHCHNEFILVIDVDTTFDRDAFERLLQPFDDARVGAVAGNLFPRNAKASLTTIYQDIEYRISISMGRQVNEMLSLLSVVSGAFGAFRRSALEEVGGLDVEIGEDADLTMKLRQAGWKIAFQPHAWAGTDVPETVSALVRQRLRWDHSIITIWLRKYDHLLHPFRGGFDIANAMVIWDVFVLQILISGLFFVYIAWLASTLGWMALVIVSATMFVYGILSAVTLLASSLGHHHRNALSLLLYIPWFVLFGSFIMRAVRLFSVVDEWIFRASYHDSYVPRRVMKEVERY